MRRRGTAPHLGALHSRRSELRTVQGKDAACQSAQADRQGEGELPDGTTEQAAAVTRRRSSSLVAKTVAAVRFRSGAPGLHMLDKTGGWGLVDAWLKIWATQGLEENRKMRRAVAEELEGRCTVQDGVIVLEGDLNLRKKCAREKLIELPGKFKVSGNFVLRNSIELTKLKGELTVDGDLSFSNCDTLTSLPEALHVCGSVNISKCWTLRLLPKNLTVGRDLELYDNCVLASLPDGLFVGGDMQVMKCNELTQCQGSMEVGGSLTLNECEALVALPNEMTVGGNLNLKSCSSLRALPNSLTVGQSLNLNGCIHLTTMPNDITIGGDLDLEGCAALETIPSALLDWPSRADGSVARVNITRTGLSDDAIESLLEMSLPNVQFLYDRDVVDRDTFKADSDFTSLKRAIGFWARAAAATCPQEGAGTRHAEDLVAALEQDLYDHSQDILIKFLSKLRRAKECGIDESRAALAQRILSILDLLREGMDTKEGILQRIADSLDTCHDKPAWALNQLVLVSLVSNARGDREALRVVGRRVMNLMIVHEHAAMKIASLESVDDVCVYLRYEIELREALNLPVGAEAMHFPNYIKISEEELDQVKDAVLAVTDAEFQNWLETWPEWERQDRAELAQEMQWESLPSTLVSGSRERQTNLLEERVHDPVKLRGQEWSLDDVLRFWVPTGLDILGAPLSVDEIRQEMKRIVYSHAEAGGGASAGSTSGRPSSPSVKLAERRPASKGWFKKTFGCMVPLKR